MLYIALAPLNLEFFVIEIMEKEIQYRKVS
jgi:hypothetical protein